MQHKNIFLIDVRLKIFLTKCLWYQYFVDLMTKSCIVHETIDNGIKANEQRIAAWGYLREDIVNLNRTRKIYNEYKTLQKSTKFFA